MQIQAWYKHDCGEGDCGEGDCEEGVVQGKVNGYRIYNLNILL